MVGGSHLSALLLAEHLDRRQFQPVILLHRGDGPLQRHLADRGLEAVVAPPGIAPVGKRAIFRLLGARARFLREAGIDIVHSNEGLMHVLWSPAARLGGVRSIWHHRGNPGARGLRLLAPVTADRVLAVSQFAAPRAGMFSAAGKARVIHSPFDTAPDLDKAKRDAQACLAALDVAPGTMVLGFFAHFSKRKRPLVFVDAIAAARSSLGRRPVLGLMFGDMLEPGLDVAVDAAIARHGLQRHVLRMGFRQPIEPWIAACHANVVPAVDEPLGRTLIEAMLIGTPVIASRSGGNPEAIRDNETGLLVRPDDPDAMARAIVHLTQPGVAARLARAASRDARARFGIARHVSAISDVYRELLPNPATRMAARC